MKKNPTKFFCPKICFAKNLRRVWRHFLCFLYISLWPPGKYTPIFPGQIKKNAPKFSGPKCVSCKICNPQNHPPAGMEQSADALSARPLLTTTAIGHPNTLIRVVCAWQRGHQFYPDHIIIFFCNL
jgi:hypothetical protein